MPQENPPDFKDFFKNQENQSEKQSTLRNSDSNRDLFKKKKFIQIIFILILFLSIILIWGFSMYDSENETVEPIPASLIENLDNLPLPEGL